jgi:hypothetical protein
VGGKKPSRWNQERRSREIFECLQIQFNVILIVPWGRLAVEDISLMNVGSIAGTGK